MVDVMPGKCWYAQQKRNPMTSSRTCKVKVGIMQQTTAIEAKCSPIREGSNPVMQMMVAFPRTDRCRRKKKISGRQKGGSVTMAAGG
jgi:hypothetical protein